MMLAQSIESIPAEWLKNLCLAAIAGIVVWDKVTAILHRKKNKTAVHVSGNFIPDPLHIKEAPEYITRREFEELKERVDDLPNMERRLNQSGEDRALSIHERINPLAEAVASAVTEGRTTQSLLKAFLRRKPTS